MALIGVFPESIAQHLQEVRSFEAKIKSRKKWHILFIVYRQTIVVIEVLICFFFKKKEIF